MSANVSRRLTHGRDKASVSRSKEQSPASRANKVLAERNQAVVAVGAWVENGEEFLLNPSALALLTEELQAERRREDEDSLRRFQDEVRHRVAQRAQDRKERQQQHLMNCDRRVPHQQVCTQYVSAEGPAHHRLLERGSKESRDGMREVRLRLAGCQMSPQGEMTSSLPEDEWNISPTKHQKAASHVDEENVEEEGVDQLFTSQHDCPLVHHKLSGAILWNSKKPPADPGSQSNLSNPSDLWPLPDPEEMKRQRQTQFLMHRRLYMSIEREQVKENQQYRKHLKRTARIKAEKEQIRLEEERKLERARQLAEAREKLEERELLILEQLKLEEEEERAAELHRRRKEEKGKERFIEALRAQMKDRLSQDKLELPPLCYCASSFWDSHPDTCANNCVFHNNPKAYAKALQSIVLSLDLE